MKFADNGPSFRLCYEPLNYLMTLEAPNAQIRVLPLNVFVHFSLVTDERTTLAIPAVSKNILDANVSLHCKVE